jgi:hypothetical protein
MVEINHNQLQVYNKFLEEWNLLQIKYLLFKKKGNKVRLDQQYQL